MSHIVIHDDIDGATQYRQFDDLGAAVAYLEEQQNAAPAARTQIMKVANATDPHRDGDMLETPREWTLTIG